MKVKRSEKASGWKRPPTGEMGLTLRLPHWGIPDDTSTAPFSTRTWSTANQADGGLWPKQ